MSADDGIYVLKTPRTDGKGHEYRVAVAQAIENVDYEPGRDTYLRGVFGKTPVTRRFNTAMRVAERIHRQHIAACSPTEYGVRLIALDMPFPATETAG